MAHEVALLAAHLLSAARGVGREGARVVWRWTGRRACWARTTTAEASAAAAKRTRLACAFGGLRGGYSPVARWRRQHVEKERRPAHLVSRSQGLAHWRQEALRGGAWGVQVGAALGWRRRAAACAVATSAGGAVAVAGRRG